jgi:hypothetical protein
MIRQPWPPLDPARVAHFKAGPECHRSGCHRTGLVVIRDWLLCGSCGAAVLRWTRL